MWTVQNIFAIYVSEDSAYSCAWAIVSPCIYYDKSSSTKIDFKFTLFHSP